MKKIESLGAFQRKAMNKEMMGKIMGGTNAPVPGGVCSGPGVRRVNDFVMQIYSSDCVDNSQGPNQYYSVNTSQDTTQCP